MAAETDWWLQPSLWYGVIEWLLVVTLTAAVAIIASRRFRFDPAKRYVTLCSALIVILASPVSCWLLQKGDDGRFTWIVLGEVSPWQIRGNQSFAKTTKHADGAGSTVVPPNEHWSQKDVVSVAESTANTEFISRDDVESKISDEIGSSMPPQISEVPTTSISSGLAEETQLLGNRLSTASVFSHLLLAFTAVWGVGSFLLLVRLVNGAFRLCWLIGNASDAETSLVQSALRQACGIMDFDSAQIKVQMSDQIQVPMAAGLFVPRVLLPRKMMGTVDEKQLTQILIHELSHLRRGDLWVVLIQHVVRIVIWFHPLIRILNRELSEAREEVCDNHVLVATNPAQYGLTLLKVAELASDQPEYVAASGLFTSRWKLEDRVSALLDSRRHYSTNLSISARLIAMSFVLTVFVSGTICGLAVAVEPPQRDSFATTDQDQPESIPSSSSNLTADDKTVIGRIIDKDGDPIANATVLFSYRAEAGSKPLTILKTESDAQGLAKFESLPFPLSELQYFSLRAWSKGYSFTQRAEHISFRTRGKEDSSSKAKDNVFTLRLVPSVRWRFRVVDETGTPVVGAELHSINSNAPIFQTLWIGRDDWQHFGMSVPVSDDDGMITVTGIQADQSYDLKLAHPSYARTPVNNVEYAKQPSDFVIEQGKEVTFQVDCPSDPEQVSKAKIEINAYGEEGGVITLDVDADGLVTTRLRDQGATIHASHPTLGSPSWYSYIQGRTRMRFSLYPQGSAVGRILDAESNVGINEAVVNFVFENRVVSSAQTDSEGRYECELPESEYRVTVSERTGVSVPEPKQEINVAVIGGKTVKVPDLFATSKPPIRGRVFDPDGQPVPHAIILRQFRIVSMADEEGRFEVESRNSRPFPIHALDPYDKLSVVQSASDANPNVRLELAAEGVVNGRVQDVDGNPVTDAKAALVVSFAPSRMASGRPMGRYMRTLLSRRSIGPDGSFRWAGLPQGYGYRIAIVGKNSTGFSTSNLGNSVTDEFQVANLSGEPVIIEADPGVLEKAKEGHQQFQIPEKRLPLGEVDWSDDESKEPPVKTPRFTLLVFGTQRHHFHEAQIVQELYVDRGLRVIGLMPQMFQQPLVTMDGKLLTFPIAFDNAKANVFKRYGMGFTSVAVLYDEQDRLVDSFVRSSMLVPTVRNHMLYGPQED